MGGFSWPKNLSDKVDGGTCVTIGEKAKIGAALRLCGRIKRNKSMLQFTYDRYKCFVHNSALNVI